MNSLVRAPVVVGVDGSPESLAAVGFAAWEAHRRRLPLRLVHGHEPPVTAGPAIVVGHGITGHLRRSRTMLENIVADLQNRYPAIETSIAVVIGDPGRLLLDESRNATLVVVGSR